MVNASEETTLGSAADVRNRCFFISRACLPEQTKRKNCSFRRMEGAAAPLDQSCGNKVPLSEHMKDQKFCRVWR